MWSELVSMFEAILFTATQALGGQTAWAILAVSFMFRLALLPLTYSIARRSLEKARLIASIQPQIARLREKYKADPQTHAVRLKELYARNEISMMDGKTFGGLIIQMPLLGAMYSAIRRVLGAGAGGQFLWIADITRPNLGLALVVASLSALAAVAQPMANPEMGKIVRWLPAVATLLMLTRLGAAYGLYWGGSTAVAALQSAMLRRSSKGAK